MHNGWWEKQFGKIEFPSQRGGGGAYIEFRSKGGGGGGGCAPPAPPLWIQPCIVSVKSINTRLANTRLDGLIIGIYVPPQLLKLY